MRLKYHLLKLVNPVLKACLPTSASAASLRKKCEKHEIRHLDLGGRSPCEGYLVIHLSPVEPYGVPLIASKTQSMVEDDDRGNFRLVWRGLTRPSIALNYDVARGIPLDEGSMEGINLSHVLEHFDFKTGQGLLRECFRILRPGGIIRVSCPDLKKYAAAYVSHDEQFWNRVGSLPYCNYPAMPTAGAILAGKAYDAHNGHLWFYDAETAMAVLREVGFRTAAEKSLHESDLPAIEEIEPRFRAVESFYVEGLK